MALRVLIVDDSLPMRALLKRILSTSGLPIESVFEAADGVEGLTQLICNDVNLILSDINMPNMNGEDFVRKVREDKKYESVKILMITTDSSVARVHRLRQLGVQGYVSKPFTPALIKEKVMALMD